MKSKLLKEARLAPKFTLVNKDGQFVQSIETGFTDKIEKAIEFSIGFDNEEIKKSYYSAAMNTTVTVKYI